MATPIQTLTRQRKQLQQSDETRLEAVANAYGILYDDLQGDIDALILSIEKLDNPTAAEIKRLPQYKRLLRDAERELDGFTTYLETSIGAAGLAGITQGLLHSTEMINSMTGGGFQSLPASAIRPLLDFLAKDGPLYARLKLITNATIDNVVRAIIDGVSSSFNPRKIADMIQDAFGGGLTDALRNVRTVQIKSYQEATRANYQESNAVTGWVWFTNLTGNPCMSCVSMHGTEHSLDETLDDHYNGECAMLPLIPEFGNPVEQSGQEWFDGLPEASQRELMGNSKHEAYKAGKFEFSALSNLQDNPVYGQMRTETSLKDLVGEE